MRPSGLTKVAATSFKTCLAADRDPLVDHSGLRLSNDKGYAITTQANGHVQAERLPPVFYVQRVHWKAGLRVLRPEEESVRELGALRVART